MASNIIDSSDENEVFVYQNYQETSIEGYKFEPSKSKTTPTEQKEGKSYSPLHGSRVPQQGNMTTGNIQQNPQFPQYRPVSQASLQQQQNLVNKSLNQVKPPSGLQGQGEGSNTSSTFNQNKTTSGFGGFGRFS